jgi:hypothetical protein
MQHMDLVRSNTIANEVRVDLNVFGALMLYDIHGHVDGANIVTKQNRSRRRWSMKLLKELMNPTSLRNNVCHRTIHSLSARTRDRVLLHCNTPLLWNLN